MPPAIQERGRLRMGMTIAEKILSAHLVDGEMVKGQEIGIKIDQTLTQDATAPWLIWNLRPWECLG